jgi:peptide deformylase
MAILKIARMGHPVLSRQASAVPDPTAAEVHRLAQDMLETMLDAPGVGLAAPQVHVGLRLIVFHVPEGRASGAEGDGSVPLTVLINPTLEALSEETALGWEGCLSIPEMMGEVPRAIHIGYRGYDLAGRLVEREASGFHARVVQHEYDHLDGILYPARLIDPARMGYVDELRKMLADEHKETEPPANA